MPSTAGTQVSLHKEVIGKFGGVFEPALALFLVRDDLVLDAVTRRSGKYASARDDGNPPSNVLHEWLEAQNPKKVRRARLRPRSGRITGQRCVRPGEDTAVEAGVS